jgi:hypothetical protein
MCCSQDTANEKIHECPAADEGVGRTLRRVSARILGRSDLLSVARQRGPRRAVVVSVGLSPVALHLLHVVCKLEPLTCSLLERPFFGGVVRSSGAELIVRSQPAISVGSRFHCSARWANPSHVEIRSLGCSRAIANKALRCRDSDRPLMTPRYRQRFGRGRGSGIGVREACPSVWASPENELAPKPPNEPTNSTSVVLADAAGSRLPDCI